MAQISNEEVLRSDETTRTFIFTIKKKSLKFMGHKIRKCYLENLTLIGHIEKGVSVNNLRNEFIRRDLRKRSKSVCSDAKVSINLVSLRP